MEKLNGGERRVFSLDPIQAAISRLALSVSRVLVDLEETQFGSNGGLPALQAWLEDELPLAALVITTDIPNCFAETVRGQVDNGLPLPRRVKEETLHHLMDRAVILYRGPLGLEALPGPVAELSSPKGGSPQGTALASVAVEVLIRNVLRAVAATSPDVRVASYGDNLIILLRCAADEQSVRIALTKAVRENFGDNVIGELNRRTRCSKPTTWFSYCGREYRRFRNKLLVQMPAQRAERFSVTTHARIEEAMASKDVEAFQKIRRSIHGWIAQNHHFPSVIEEAAELLAHIKYVWPKPPLSSASDLAADFGSAVPSKPL
jgi:hypothetical protein